MQLWTCIYQLYINNLLKSLKTVAKLFADDTSLLSVVNKRDSANRHMKIKRPNVHFVIKIFLIENGHPKGVLHFFSVKNIFYDNMDLRLFYFHVTKWTYWWPPHYVKITSRKSYSIQTQVNLPKKFFSRKYGKIDHQDMCFDNVRVKRATYPKRLWIFLSENSVLDITMRSRFAKLTKLFQLLRNCLIFST